MIKLWVPELRELSPLIMATPYQCTSPTQKEIESRYTCHFHGMCPSHIETLLILICPMRRLLPITKKNVRETQAFCQLKNGKQNFRQIGSKIEQNIQEGPNRPLFLCQSSMLSSGYWSYLGSSSGMFTQDALWFVIVCLTSGGLGRGVSTDDANK